MSLLSKIKSMFAGPVHIDDDGDPEADAALHEDFATPDEGEADVKAIADGASGGAEGIVQPSFAASEAAEAAEEDLDSEEAPADPDP